MISFKDFMQVQESVESDVDKQISELKAKLDEAGFDWSKTGPSIFTKDKSNTKTADGKTVNTGTYGTDRHKAPNDSSKPKSTEIKPVGRPAGEYAGSYKIDSTKRDSKEYKDALSKKVSDAKREGFKVRDEFKNMMGDALKKREQEINNK